MAAAEPWVGPWLHARRFEKGEERTRLSEIAPLVKRDISALSRIESGQQPIPADDLPMFLAAYDLTPEDFAKRASKEAA
jgi:transcriptional regulator with XRE-family HTH domain